MKTAFIPARGGSKRIPGKNLKLLDGRPLISYALDAVISSEVFDKIILSSDSDEILDLGKNSGVSVIKRTKELSDDFSTLSDVMKDYILTANHSVSDLVCCVLPSNPFTQPASFIEALKLIPGWDYVFTVLESQKPPERALVRDETGLTKIAKPEYQFARTQDLPVSFYDAGQFYLALASTWTSDKSILNSRSFGITLPVNSVVDIDSFSDWTMAEMLIRSRRGNLK
jgi:N-acylneuraminate cytidylyltransferase